ncbi:MAG: serine/threonine-protein phosphatase [Oscillospiraceae bacterium]|nr:serine/threonine-protein phosphatase [Oscillospiraceae bacterium]
MISAAYYSSRGGLEINEDFVHATVNGNKCCAVVADGLGAYGGGEQASREAVRAIFSGYRGYNASLPDPGQIGVMFQLANAGVYAIQCPGCEMKTTAAALFIEGDRACWAHVGDTRIYHFYGGELISQTVDHSLPQLAVDIGKIDANGIRFHKGRNQVLMALGTKEGVQPEISETTPLHGGLNAFLICTDGFWEYVYETEMLVDLCKSENPKQWLEFMRLRLQQRANGSNDNNTAAAVFVQL